MITPFICRGSGPSTASTTYADFSARGSGESFDIDEADVTNLCPADFTLQNLKITLPTAPGASKSWTFTVRKNGADTAVTVTISDSATSGEDTSNTVSFSAGDQITLSATPSNTPAATDVLFYAEADAATKVSIVFGTNDGTNYNNTGTQHAVLTGSHVWRNNETDARAPFPTDGTFKAFYVYLDTAPGVGNSVTVTLRIEGADTSLTVTFSDSEVEKNVTADVAVSAGELVNVRKTLTGTPDRGRCNWGIHFAPDTDGETPILAAPIDDLAGSGATEYHPIAGRFGWSATSTDGVSLAPAFTARKLYGLLKDESPGAGETIDLTLRDDDADTALTVQFQNSETTKNNTGSDVSIADSSELNIKVVSSAGVGTPDIHWGWVAFVAPVAAAVAPQRTLTGAGG